MKLKNPDICQKENEETVKEWFNEWLWPYKHKYEAKTTFKDYVSKVKNHIIRVFGDRKLSDVTTLEIQKFINDLTESHAPSTVKQIFKVDEMCYPFAVLIDTGLRTSELCGIKWKNIDFINKRILIKQSYQRVSNFDYINGEIVKINSSLEETPLKSKTSERVIPMSKGVYNILMLLSNETISKKGTINDDDFVFINKIGNPIVGDCLRNRLKDLLLKHNLSGISLHRFRHTFATRPYEAKVQLKNIQALLGHSTVKTTERYLHIDDNAQVDAIEQLENYYESVGVKSIN